MKNFTSMYNTSFMYLDHIGDLEDNLQRQLTDLKQTQDEVDIIEKDTLVYNVKNYKYWKDMYDKTDSQEHYHRMHLHRIKVIFFEAELSTSRSYINHLKTTITNTQLEIEKLSTEMKQVEAFIDSQYKKEQKKR